MKKILKFMREKFDSKDTTLLGMGVFLLMIWLSITLSSCKKQEGCTDINATNYNPTLSMSEGNNALCEYPPEFTTKPITTPTPDCNCGVIANDGITDNCYWLEIRNNCSGNKKQFCFDQDVWMSNYTGGNFCVLGVQPW